MLAVVLLFIVFLVLLCLPKEVPRNGTGIAYRTAKLLQRKSFIKKL
jgi:hypothetical protein